LAAAAFYPKVDRATVILPQRRRIHFAISASAPDFLCNAVENFGKEWETVCVRTKTKTMKAIENIVGDLS
jgi:hypothetical protein